VSRVLIAGCGYVGSRLAELLVDDGVDVWGLKRRPTGLPHGVVGLEADVTDPATLRPLPAGLDAVVYAISPAGRTAEAYRLAYVEGLENLLDAVSAPVRTVLVSSTGVYGHTDGRWVDEETPEDPSDPTAELVRAGEAVARSRGAPGVVVRLGGIYGPGRTRTIRMVLAGEAPCMAPDVYGNRIHRDDAAGALRHVLRLRDPAPVYLGVDRDPAPLRDVYAWIADRGRAPDPCAGVEPDEAGVGGRRGTNKRCSSRRLQDSGYAFRYPTFREGYAPLVGKELAG
jgi:nucleoside-diphosphate-sugar epimerase